MIQNMIRETVYLVLAGIVLISVVQAHQNHQNQQIYQQATGYNPQVPSHQQQQQQHQQQQQQPHQHQNPDQTNQMMNNINKDHVLEHLDGMINKPKEQMTQDEQNFYYFKLHDYDNNNMLDGLELVSAFAHNEEHKEDNFQDPNKPEPSPHPVPTPRISDDELIKLIDEIMKDEDKNLDGYITYNEFLHAIKM